jgi:putative hemolysin
VITKEDFTKTLGLDKYQLELLAVPLMKLMKIDRFNELLAKTAHKEGFDFIDTALKELNIKIEVSQEELNRIPKKGSFMIVANHPFGALDDMILLSVIAKLRPDFKLMTDFNAESIPQLKSSFIPFTLDEQLDKKLNSNELKGIFDYLQQGNAIGFFPASEVSQFQASKRKIIDKEWNLLAGKFIKKAKVNVVPVYISGSNSVLFNILGMINSSLRDAKLPSEMLNKKDDTVVVRIGNPIKTEQLEDFANTYQMLRFLRAKTYALGSTLKISPFFRNPFKRKAVPEPIIEAVPTEKLEEDLLGLREESLIITHQNYEVFIAEATDIPHILRQIGRLREITFRAEGEGTNRSIDIDEYDIHYLHLFIWDRDARKIVGAYRIGRGAELYNKFKLKGFYLNELFKIETGFAPIIKKSLEMGRSFIIEEYQGKHASLFLLWKGVLVYLKNNPEYRYLIGPVSISNSFSILSKELMVKFIKQHHYDWELAKLVKPRKKFKPKLKSVDSEILLNQNFKNLKDLDSQISEIEATNAKVPILLKKYISQNSKIICFNIDPKFNDALDGFLIMDLQNVPEDTIKMLDKTA